MGKDHILCPHPDCTSRFTTSGGLVKHMTKQHDHDQLSGSSDSASETEFPTVTGARATTSHPAKRPVAGGVQASTRRFEGMGKNRPVKSLTKDKRGYKKALTQVRNTSFPIKNRRRRTPTPPPTPPPRRREYFRSIAMAQLGETAGSSSAVHIDLRTPSLVSDIESTTDSGSSDQDRSGSDAFGLCGGSAVSAKEVDTPKTAADHRISSASKVALTNVADRTALTPIFADRSKMTEMSTTIIQPSTTPPSASTSPLTKKPSWVVRTPSPITLVDRRPAVSTIGQSGSPQSADSDADDDESESGSGEVDGVSAELEDDSARSSVKKASTFGSQVGTSTGKANPAETTHTANRTAADIITNPIASAREATGCSKTAVSSSEDEALVTPSKPPVRPVTRKSPPALAHSLIQSILRTPNALEAFRLGALEKPAELFFTPSDTPTRLQLRGADGSTAKMSQLSVTPEPANKNPRTPSVPFKASSNRPPCPNTSLGNAAGQSNTLSTTMTRTFSTTLKTAQQTDRPMMPDLLSGNTHKVLGAIARFLLDLSEIGSDSNRAPIPGSSSGMHTRISDAGIDAGISRERKRARGNGDEEDEGRAERVKRLTEDLRGITGL